MKTTIELPDTLFRQAKAIAIERRTTLKALITSALKREITPIIPTESDVYGVDEEGLPYIPSRGKRITNETINELLDSMED